MVRTKMLAAVGAAALLGLTACGGDADAGSGGGGESKQIDLVGFSILEAANEPLIEAFEKTPEGKGVTFKTSYGASGDQSRAVEGGLKAGAVHFSLEGDVTRLVDAGLVADDWNTGPTKGILTQSVVAIVVRKGNPKNIEGWEDLVKPGVDIVTPNPGSSGSARWNILAAYGHTLATGGTEADAKTYLEKFFEHTVALPSSGRDATTAFSGGTGDALISYENEAILARQKGEDFDYIVPDQTLLIENPGAVTKGAPAVAKKWLDYQVSKEGQKSYASFGFRPLVDVGDLQVDGANDPSNPFPQPEKLLTIANDFGGWSDAADTFFDEENGLVTKIQAETGKS
jgi:sulfate transport system substrate-binding protein